VQPRDLQDGPKFPLLIALSVALVAVHPALADIEDCGSREFHREFLVGSPMEPVEGPTCGLTSPNPTLVKAGDRVLPCLAAIVEGTGPQFPECRKDPKMCRSWAMGTIAASRTSRAASFLMSLAGSTSDSDRLIGAASFLASMHAQQAVPILFARLNSGDDRVRTQLVMSLGVLQARDHKADLVRTTLGLKPEDFYRAIHGFRFLGEPSVVPALQKYVDAMPASNMRTLLIGQVNEIGIVANFQAGMEQKNGGILPWSESFLRAAIDDGERTGARSQLVGEAYYELGEICRKDGRLDEAEALFARAAVGMRTSLSPSDGKSVDLEIARALVRDARGTDPLLVSKFCWFSRLLQLAQPERKKEVWARFPELRDAFERYALYCRANKLQGCQRDLNDYLPYRLRGAANSAGGVNGG
jgi:hypothetical protein